MTSAGDYYIGKKSNNCAKTGDIIRSENISIEKLMFLLDFEKGDKQHIDII